MTNTQRAVLVKEIGQPVQLGTRDIPRPTVGQVLLRVTATMILPHDTYGRDWGLLIDRKLPAVLGSNVAGVIEAVGDGVTLRVRERVFGISFPDPVSSDQGGLQQYALLNANAIGKTPEGFSDEQVVTLPINLVTSWTILFTSAGFNLTPPLPQQKNYDHADTSIVIIGGGTNVGQFAVQLAHAAGVGKIIVIAGPSNSDRLKSMGATHVIDRYSLPADIGRQVQAIMHADGATWVYSCAQLQVDLAVAVLSASEPSRLRTLLPIEADEANILLSQRPRCDASFLADLTNDSMEPYAEMFWVEVSQLLKDGKILPTEHRIIDGLEKVGEINEALDNYRDSTRSGPQTVVKVAR